MPIPLAADPEPHAGRRRWKRAGQTAGAQALAKIVAGVCQLLLVPLLLDHLGTDAFGWVMALVMLSALASFADLGVLTALQQELSERWSAQDWAALRQSYASGCRLLRWLGLGWFVVALPTAWWIGPHLLAAPGGSNSHGVWVALTFTTCFTVALGPGTRLAAAVQAGWIHASWTMAANIIALIGCIGAVWLTAPFWTFVVILTLPQPVASAMAGWHTAQTLGWAGSHQPGGSDDTCRLWRTGLHYASAAMAGALLQAATPLAFVRLGSYEAGAAFAVLQRLFGPFVQLHSLVLAPLWPAVAEACARGETRWITRSLFLGMALSGLTAAGIATLAILLPWVLPFWLGAAALMPPLTLLAPIAVWSITGLFFQTLYVVVLGFGRVANLSTTIAAIQVATLLAMFGAGLAAGAAGVAVALTAGTAFGLLPLFARETGRALRSLEPSRARAA